MKSFDQFPATDSEYDSLPIQTALMSEYADSAQHLVNILRAYGRFDRERSEVAENEIAENIY